MCLQRQMAPLSRVAAAVWVAKWKYFEGGEFLERRGQRVKFKLEKTIFNAKNFIRRLSQSIFSDFGAIRSWIVCRNQKSPKICENLYFGI